MICVVCNIPFASHNTDDNIRAPCQSILPNPTSVKRDIRSHSGSKYVRKIRSCITREIVGEVDVYSVAEAFAVDDMPLNHAMKKIL